MRPGAANIVQFENVGLRYGAGAETLSDISFSLETEIEGRWPWQRGDRQREV